jgi:hypothetical protein
VGQNIISLRIRIRIGGKNLWIRIRRKNVFKKMFWIHNTADMALADFSVYTIDFILFLSIRNGFFYNANIGTGTNIGIIKESVPYTKK